MTRTEAVGVAASPGARGPALTLDEILVNGGRRGLNLRLRVADLVRVTGARPVDATRPDAAAECTGTG